MKANNRLFDIDEVTGLCYPKRERPRANGHYLSKYLLTHFAKVKKLQVDVDRLPEPGEISFLQSDGQWNAFTFIPFLLQWYQIKELHACTYSISRRAIEAMVELYDAGKIDRLVLMINDSMRKRNAATTDLLAGLARERGNIEVKYAWVHAKVTLIKTMAGHFVVEGSGNLSENAHYEQYLLANSRGLYDFRMELFENAKIKY